jgi:hypothetical protein
MARFWLTPVTAWSPLMFGEQRILCEDQAAFHDWRQSLYAVNPRLLPLFKAGLLLSDGEEDDEALSCGIDDELIDWASGKAIVFDGQPLHLSHCGEAFLDRLLQPKDALALLVNANIEVQDQIWSPLFTEWLLQGWSVIVLKEEA